MYRHALWVMMAIVLLAGGPASGQIVPPGTTPTQLVTGYNFTEGPLYDGAGGVFFSDLGRADIVRYDIASDTAQVVDPSSGAANGLIMDSMGRVISADRDRRQVSRRSAANITTVETVLANNWMGALFNGPNDLVMDATGGIYFTDPDYENRRSTPEAFYYISAAGALSRLATFPMTGSNRRPNGIALSPNGSVLYVAVEMNKRIMAYDVGPGGTVSNERLFALTNVNANGTTLPNITNGPDGIAIDAAGNVYCAVQNAVFAWSPNGQRLFDLPIPQDPTNAKFGSVDGRTLFITAGSNNAASLWSIELNVPAPDFGDFDGDGAVDAADYTIWRDTLGDTANQSADGDGNGTVDAADLDVWSSRFGNALGSGAAAIGGSATVPEPSGVVMLTTIAGTFARIRKRPRRTYACLT